MIVQYEGEFFPGQILNIREIEGKNEYYVSVMTMSGPNGWRWPEKSDVIWYEQVLCKINTPTPINVRGICEVPELNKYRTQRK